MGGPDARRTVPRTDDMLADARLVEARDRLGLAVVRAAVGAAQDLVRAGAIVPAEAVDAAVRALPATASSLRRVLNATGILVHTNLGRAPLSRAAVDAVVAAAGSTDVELDLATGRRGPRGAGVTGALLALVPAAEAAHVVNNGAAALVLAATALGRNRSLVIARGEMVEIGDGFRIPELLESTGARLVEVGTTNRVCVADYAAAVGPDTGAVLKIHTSNFVVRGFTSAATVSELAGLGPPVVSDIGSGLLSAFPGLPDEPDAQGTLAAGADLVTASGDKLLGGPQAGIMLGRKNLLERIRRDPLARALRVDKLTLAALEATLRGPRTPVRTALETRPADVLARVTRVVAALCERGVDARAVDSVARVGGGGAPEVDLASAAVSLPAEYAESLRANVPAVLGRVESGQCLLDLRSVDPADDETVCAAVVACTS